MTKTNTGLVEHVVNLLGAPYLYGCNGKTITEELIKAKTAQYPERYTPEYIARSRKGIGRIGYDCSAVIDTYVGVDKSANAWLEAAKEKGTIDTMPQEVGLLVHMNGHVGVYIGNGYVVEARGVDYGVVKTKLNERAWRYWSKNPLIVYEAAAERAINPFPVPTATLYRYSVNNTKTAVKWLQFELNMRYGAAISIDGIFGSITQTYLGRFQEENGLTVDYKCGIKTRTKLIDSRGND